MKRLGLEYKNTLMIPMFENSSQREKNKITINSTKKKFYSNLIRTLILKEINKKKKKKYMTNG